MNIDQTTHDHTLVEHCALALRRVVREGRADDVSVAYSALRDALLTHLADEEGALFPYIRRQSPGWGDELDALVADHEALRRLLGDVGAAVDAGETAAVEPAVMRFYALLEAHSLREADLLSKTYTELFPERFVGG